MKDEIVRGCWFRDLSLKRLQVYSISLCCYSGPDLILCGFREILAALRNIEKEIVISRAKQMLEGSVGCNFWCKSILNNLLQGLVPFCKRLKDS